jgi:hypothetical protein
LSGGGTAQPAVGVCKQQQKPWLVAVEGAGKVSRRRRPPSACLGHAVERGEVVTSLDTGAVD